jgi:hypothetical protein
MNLPGFTAEASFFTTGIDYSGTMAGLSKSGAVLPNWFYNPGFLVRGYFFAAPNLAIDHAVESGNYSAHQTDNA